MHIFTVKLCTIGVCLPYNSALQYNSFVLVVSGSTILQWHTLN